MDYYQGVFYSRILAEIYFNDGSLFLIASNVRNRSDGLIGKKVTLNHIQVLMMTDL